MCFMGSMIRSLDDACGTGQRQLLQAQHPALDLAGGGHGQLLDKRHLLGVFVGRQAAAHMLLQRAHLINADTAIVIAGERTEIGVVVTSSERATMNQPRG